MTNEELNELYAIKKQLKSRIARNKIALRKAHCDLERGVIVETLEPLIEAVKYVNGLIEVHYESL